VSEAAVAPMPVPPEPGIPPEYLVGEPATAEQVLGPHARGRVVWEAHHARFGLRAAVRAISSRTTSPRRLRRPGILRLQGPIRGTIIVREGTFTAARTSVL